jgi:uncharacterized integral membrane protein
LTGFLKALVLVPVAIVVILLAVANRGPVTLSLDPFAREMSALKVTVPIFVLIFAAVMAGVLIGGAAAWLAQGKNRRAARGQRREAERLRAETERLKSAMANQPRADRHALPANRNAA